VVGVTTQFSSQAQDVTRSMYGAFRGMAEPQLNILQKLTGVGANQFNLVMEAASEQMQLIGQVRDPKQYAWAQAGLLKNHGQRYVDSVKDSVNIIVEAWRQYGDRPEQTARMVTDDARQVTSPRKS
jgi:hypothetical protein